jgi:hypothetical protein
MRYVLYALTPIVIWVLVTLFFSYSSGWSSLAKLYQTSQPVEGRRWKQISGKMGYSWMRSSLNLGANEQGLSLSLSVLFRPGNPPLFIPWGEITTGFEKGLLVNYMKFHFVKVPTVNLLITERVGREVLQFVNTNSGRA